MFALYKRKTSPRETVILISNLTFLQNIFGDVLKRYKKLFTTCVYLSCSKYLFSTHRSSEYLSFSVFMLQANINRSKTGQLLKATCSS